MNNPNFLSLLNAPVFLLSAIYSLILSLHICKLSPNNKSCQAQSTPGQWCLLDFHLTLVHTIQVDVALQTTLIST